MGAPFWSEQEKQYFLEHIVPRSHYATGYYEEEGRSFEDLAEVMQRDLDDRGWSRRQYNGDLLFQHWYQKVRPTAAGDLTSSSTHNPSPLASTPAQSDVQGSTEMQQHPSASNANPDPVTGSSASEEDLAQDPTKLEMDESISPGEASKALDKNDTDDSPSPLSGQGPASELSLPIHSAVDPAQGSDSPSMMSTSNGPPPAPKKRARKEVTGGADGGASKKSKRAKKGTANVAAQGEGEPSQASSTRGKKSNSKAIGQHGNAHGTLQSHPSPVHLTSSPDVSPRTQPVNSATTIGTAESGRSAVSFRFSAPPGGHGYTSNDEYNDSPYHLRHPVPLPPSPHLPSEVAARDPYSNPYTAPRPRGGTALHPRAGAGVSATSLPAPRTSVASGGRPSHPARFMLDEAARHRQMMPAQSSYRAPPPPPPPPDPPSHGPRTDSVTGQRLGEVTLQGTTLMTYCPACQRPF